MNATTAEKVKERPILFAAPMVRAILDGRKTQTRRVVKDQPPCLCRYEMNQSGTHALCLFDAPHLPGGMGFCPPTGKSKDHRLACPYGQPGDRLWVRETFRFPSGLDAKSPVQVAESCLDANYPRPWSPTKYEADGTTVNRGCLDDFGGGWGKARVSIHMPRWASRITLKITGIRVERLHDISDEDKAAEGATADVPFGTVWREINTKPGIRWDDNPWVWAITFRRITPEPTP